MSYTGNRCRLTALVTLFIFWTLTVPAASKVVYVSPDGSDSNSGLSWSRAKRSISAALLVAIGGDQIWVRHGVYYERITLKSGVAVYGGFRGTETSLSQRPPFPRRENDPYESIIHGGWGPPSIVTTPPNPSRPYRLDGFTISYGRDYNGGGINVNDSSDLLTVENCIISRNHADTGGGVFIGNNSSPRFINCVISDNHAQEHGGGIAVRESSPQLIGCTVKGNVSSDEGGGVFFYYGAPVMIGCSVSSNTARLGGGISSISSQASLSGTAITNNTAFSAGGIYCHGSSVGTPPTLVNCLISGNSATDTGGGMRCESPVVLENCVVSGNSASSGGGLACGYSLAIIKGCVITSNAATFQEGGGVLLIDSRYATIYRTIISHNVAVTNGGGVSIYRGSTLVTSCVISENSAGDRGGGLYTKDGVSTVTDCIVANNSAGDGGGMFLLQQSTFYVLRCVIRGNTAGFDGGGIHSRSSYPVFEYCIISMNSAGNNGGALLSHLSEVRLTNCTITYNTASEHGGAISLDRMGVFGNCIIAYNSSGIHCSSGEPREFSYNCVWANETYNFYGMPDMTGTSGNISVDPMISGSHLLPGSPCINAGANFLSPGYHTDIDGEPIIGDGIADIGADEFHVPIVQGRILFGDYGGSPPIVFFEIRDGDPQVRMAIPDPDGGFAIGALPTGAFDLSLKPMHWLRRTVGVDTSDGSVTDLEIYLVNGDIDGDNEVTLFDFGQLVAAFGTMPGDSNWNPNADLDGDKEVSLFDFSVLVRNFGEIGDD
jgi:predicted outer membrane repeat protein